MENEEKVAGQEKNLLDDYIIGEGFAIADTNEKKPASHSSSKKKKKKKGVLGSLAWIFAIIFVSVGLAAVALVAVSDYLGIGPGRGHECVIEIQPGSSTRAIAAKLKESGAINSELLFRLFSKIKGYDGQYQYGVYTFSDEAGFDSIAEMLITEGAVAETTEVMIPERTTVDEIMALLEEKGVCSKSDFKQAVQTAAYSYDFVGEIPEQSVYWRLEGYLFPDTYSFYSYDDSAECARLAVHRMLDRFDEQFTSEMRAQAKEMGYSTHQILTLASIIELEASSADYADKQKVAAIFYNRLNDWGDGAFLQSNPTRDYPHGGGRYDTYKTAGLPAGPLCSPSLDSIKAALNPSTEYEGYYYFITDKFMNFYYNQTLDAHVNTQNRLIRDGIYYVD